MATIVVRSAGSAEVNGDYEQTLSMMDGVSKYRLQRIGLGGVQLEYHVCRSMSSKTKTKKWWICRTDRNGIESDIDFYTCESESDTPPAFGWVPLKGVTPVPSVRYVPGAGGRSSGPALSGQSLLLSALASSLGVPTLPSIVAVRGAGSGEVNGDFERIGDTMDGVPKYRLERQAGGVEMQYHVCRSVSSKTKTKKWWICRTDRNGIVMDIDFYTCENESDIPPTSGWVPLRGVPPCPSVTNVSAGQRPPPLPVTSVMPSSPVLSSMGGGMGGMGGMGGLSALPTTTQGIKALITQLSTSNANSALETLVSAAELSSALIPVLYDLGVLPPVLRMLAADVTHEKALELIFIMAKDHNVVPKMLSQVLPVLRRCCEDWPDHVRKKSVNPISILSKISVCEKTEEPMVEAGLHVLLLMATSAEDTRASAFNALLNIAFAKNCKQPLLDIGAIRVALEWGKDDTNSSAFKFLRSMSLHPPAFPMFSEVGMVPLLARNLANNYKDEQNIWFISNLSDLPEACAQIVACGCLPYLKAAMEDSSPPDENRFKSWAITAIWRISKVPGCRASLLAIRIQDTLLMHTRMEVEPALAMMALALLVGREEEGRNSQYIRADKGMIMRLIDRLMDAVGEYTSGRAAFVKTKCSVLDYLTAISCIATADVNKAELTEEKALGALLDCAEQCDPQSVVTAIDILLELSFSPVGMEKLQREPAKSKLMRVKAKIHDPAASQRLDSLLFRLIPQAPALTRRKSALGMTSLAGRPPMTANSVPTAVPPPTGAPAAAALDRALADKQTVVFLSYHHVHQAMARRIADDLRKRNLFVWLDVDQGTGADERAEGIEASHVVLMDISWQYKESANCRLEAQYAVQLKKKIIPLTFEENYTPNGWLGLLVGNVRSLRAWHQSHYAELITSLVQQIGPAAQSASSPSSVPAPSAGLDLPPPYEPVEMNAGPPAAGVVSVPPPYQAVPAPHAVVASAPAASHNEGWVCASCTFANHGAMISCELCGANKTVPPPGSEQKREVPRPEEKGISAEQVSLVKLQEQTNQILRSQVSSLSAQMAQALTALQSEMNVSKAQHERDLDTLKREIAKNPQALPQMVQDTMSTTAYEEMVANTERRLQAGWRAHASALDGQISVLTTQLSSVSAKTNAMYAVHTQQQTVLMEQKTLLTGSMAPFYSTAHSVVSARLQGVLLVASGVLQGKAGNIVGVADASASAATAIAQQAVGLVAESCVLAADCIPLVGCVVGAILRKGGERIDAHRQKKRAERLGNHACTTSDAEALGELAARRCAQFFEPFITAEKGRLDEDALEKAGRRAGEKMYAALIGGSFDALLDEAEKKEPKLQDRELTAWALVLAVSKVALQSGGILKKEGGIFTMKLTQSDVEELIAKNSNVAMSPAERERRRQQEDMTKQQAAQLELLQKQMAVACVSPRAAVPPASTAPPPPVARPVSGANTNASMNQDVGSWLGSKQLPMLVPIIQEVFPTVKMLYDAFKGMTAQQIRDELGLQGLPGLGTATKLRNALDSLDQA